MHLAASVIALTLVTAASTGCVTRHVVCRYDAARLVPAGGIFRAVPGTNQVLVLSKTTAIPIPHGVSGYFFYVQLAPALIHEDEVVEIPSERAQSHLVIFRAPVYDRSTTFTGSIRILKTHDEFVEAEVDLRADDVGWRYKGRAKFVSAIITPQFEP